MGGWVDGWMNGKGKETVQRNKLTINMKDVANKPHKETTRS